MKKQLWLLCKNNKEEQELLSMYPNFKVHLESKKKEFPIVIDLNKKMIFRCTSVSSCGAYSSSENKILTLHQLKQTK